MTKRDDMYYEAYVARDARYDGVFYMGVTSTGIYCRPVCTARRPKWENCRFFDSGAEAEAAGFRACLKCRPELAKGFAPVDDGRRIPQDVVARLRSGVIEDGAGPEEIAAQFEVSGRQLRRMVKSELGVTPRELIAAQRLTKACQLLKETAMPVTEVAFESGFGSLRRFHDAFKAKYGVTPLGLRKGETA